jgi:hypothetical protein
MVRDPQHDVVDYPAAMPSASDNLPDECRHLGETTIDETALPFWR